MEPKPYPLIEKATGSVHWAGPGADKMPTATLYKRARRRIHSGDLLALQRPGQLRRFSLDGASHIMTAVWREADQKTLSIAESREGKGGRVVSVSEEVHRFPGLIDVYTPTADCPTKLRERAATIAYNWAGHAYDYPGLFDMALKHLGYGPDANDMTLLPWDSSKVCSVLHVWAYRWAKFELSLEGRWVPPDVKRELAAKWITEPGQWDPMPGLGDHWIWPYMLTHSGSYKLVCKGLVHDEDVHRLKAVA